ncbi:hypothetical protein L218DRAFT_990768 [Marasmius fiardii PR-910]|nr:hypothetical protein L218DRAFT_990768 [Marasmius fiardii PR-910]
MDHSNSLITGASKVNIGAGHFSTVGRDQYNNYYTTWHPTIVQTQGQTMVLNEHVTTVIGAISGGAEVLGCLLRILEHGRPGVSVPVREGVVITSHNKALKDLKPCVACTVDVFIRYHDAIGYIEDQAVFKDFYSPFISFRKIFVHSDKKTDRSRQLLKKTVTWASKSLDDVIEEEVPRLKSLSDPKRKYFKTDDQTDSELEEPPAEPTSNATTLTEQIPAATEGYPPTSHNYSVEDIIEDLSKIIRIAEGDPLEHSESSEPQGEGQNPSSNPDSIRDDASVFSYASFFTAEESLH